MPDENFGQEPEWVTRGRPTLVVLGLRDSSRPGHK